MVQDGHLIRDRQRLLGIMGDKQGTGAAGGQHGRQLAPQPLPHLHVQVGEGLIQQHHAGLGRQGPGQGEPLPLASGEFMGIAVLQPLQAEQGKQPAHPIGSLSPAQAEAGIGHGVEMGKEGVVLKDHPHPPTLRRQEAGVAGHLPPINPDPTTLGLFKAGDQAQQGGLATAGGAQQAEQFALGQGEIHPPQGPRVRSGGAVAMPDPFQSHPLNRCGIGRVRADRAVAGTRAWACGGRSGKVDRQGP